MGGEHDAAPHSAVRAAAAVLLLLAGCSAPAAVVAVAPTPPQFPDCPAAVAIPAALPRIRTPERIAKFAVDLELFREQERARGDACAAAVEAMREWIKEPQK